MSKINQLDRIPGKNKPPSKDAGKNNTSNNGPSRKFNPNYKPCIFCEKIGNQNTKLVKICQHISF